MNLAALRAWRRVTGLAPAQTLRVPALGLRQWVAAMGHTPGMLRGLSLQGVLLPEPDLDVLIDPLRATGLDVLPAAVDRVAPAAPSGPPAKHRMKTAMPVTGAREPGAVPGHRAVRPTAVAFGSQSESSRGALEEARRAGSQPARLATILQRYAGSVSQLRADAHVPAGRGIGAIGVAPQRPTAGRKVVCLPARQAVSVAMPDAVRAAAAPARWEANMAATLKRWAQAGAAGTGLPGRARQGGTAMPLPRLPNSVQAAKRATAMSASHPTWSADTPASATPSAPVAASAARLAQAVRAALGPAAASAQSPHAAAQPVLESLTRIVEQLTSIEIKFSQAAGASPAAVESREEAPTVQWLEDDDLAGRLQAILRRQAKRRGIDLS